MSSFICLSIAIVLFAWIRLFSSGKDDSRIDRQAAVLWLLAMGWVVALVCLGAPVWGGWVWLVGFVAVNGLAIQAAGFWFGFSWCNGIEIGSEFQ